MDTTQNDSVDNVLEFEKIAQRSLYWNRPPSQEQKEWERELFGKPVNHEPRFENFEERLKYQNRHDPASLWDEILMSDNKERYKKVLRKQSQAKLSRRLHKETAERLGVTKPVYDDIPPKYLYLFERATTSVTPAMKNNQLQFSRNRMQLRVSIHPYIVRGHHEQLETGTLQAHANGFRFSNCSIPLQMDVMYDNVKHAFFQEGDEEMTPLLHLHLHNTIKLGNETTKDIQFRMVQTFERKRRKGPLALDSDKLDKEEQKTVDTQLVQKFVWHVNYLWRSFNSINFQKMEKTLTFRAELRLKNHTSLSSFLVMTLYCLVHLRQAPFFVVTLEEIEVVNLVLPQPKSVFDMTIVFKDFSRDVRHINSIPSKYIDKIKEWLDARRVKYYENEQEDISDWRTKLKMITDDPTSFINDGGWDFLLNSGENGNQDADNSEESLANSSDITSDDSD